MKLSDALWIVKESLALDSAADPCNTMVDDKALCRCLQCRVPDLINAVEAHLEAERKQAREIIGLADLQKWGGE